MRQWLTMMAGGLCLALASSVHALGVGDPQQVSPLNRPLHVVLPLTDGNGLEASQVSVAVADDAAYRQSGLTRSALVDALSAKVVRQSNGLTVVLDSPRRVREPFVDLLLIVTWPEGQWQRAVSLLFDPVGYASSQPLLDGDRDSTQRYALSGSAAARARPMDSAFAGDVGPHPVSREPSTLPWPSQVTVRTGDSLSTLAASLLPRPGMSRQSLMVALFQSNPAAFVDGDVNRLRAGVSLDVPTTETVTDVSRAEAVSRLSALARKTEDGRPVIDIVGRKAIAAVPETSVSDTLVSEASAFETPVASTSASTQLATLKQRLSNLTAETERQRATIDALQSERDALQGALAAVDAPPVMDMSQGRESSQSAAINVSVAAAAAATPVASDKVTAGATPADATTSGPGSKAVASSAEPSPPASSLWQRLLEHLDWIGGGLLIGLLVLWVWQRRRRHTAHAVVDTTDETSANIAAKPTSRASHQSPSSTTPRRSVADVNVDSVSISQADIYMAYGRHAEARDWLRQQLAQEENAQFRLGLLRALGELRDMDALEQALSGFGDDATPEQRHEGQVLVDDYRARYVEESWQEATGEAADEPSETVWQGGAPGVDALFESQMDQSETESESGAARFEPETAAFSMHIVPHSSSIQDGNSGHQSDSLSALRDDDLTSTLFDDDLTSSVDPAATSLLASHIDYEAPTLELDVTRADAAASPSSVGSASSIPSAMEETTSSTVLPAIDFSALSLEPVSMGPVETAPDSRHHETPGSDRFGAPNAALPAGAGKTGGTPREVPAGWDVEEVEFQSSHRDNGRP